MASDNRPTVIARIVVAAAMLAAAGCVSGCGQDHIGPDPLPWSPPPDPVSLSR